VGLFSLFGKKNRSPDSPDEDAAGSGAEAPGYPQVDRRVASRPPPNQVERRVAARATVMKIDAIETEMTRDIHAPAAPRTIIGTSPSTVSPGNTALPDKATTQLPLEIEAELPDDGALPLATIEVSAGGGTQDLDEAAILFASKQYPLAESMLQQALLEGRGRHDTSRTAWWMLFDLYQVLQRQDDFESLSIDYASLFETSPPAWHAGLYPQQAPSGKPPASAPMPAIAFTGPLGQGIEPQLQRLQKLAAGQPCRLDFARVTEVEPAGCALLLPALQQVQKAGHALVLAGAEPLVDKIRAIVKIGRLDETATTWLLLLEILRLLNREQEFEEASLDYCVTFEVSPPQFEAPRSPPAAAAVPQAATPAARADGFLMPAVIEGDCSALLRDMQVYAEQHQPVLFNCTQLARIEFVAVGQLLSQLAPLVAAGKTIEFRGVNHLVITLFNLMGLNGIARIVPRHY
jgi:ABC-type transporter Mla MlaB component